MSAIRRILERLGVVRPAPQPQVTEMCRFELREIPTGPLLRAGWRAKTDDPNIAALAIIAASISTESRAWSADELQRLVVPSEDERGDDPIWPGEGGRPI